MSDARKQSLYFPEEMLRQMQDEAIRQDRSLSWVVQRAWRLARERIAKLPASGVASPPTPRAADATGNQR
ncbi:MAG TPA: TIGR04563 family protein [Anaeromyxobacter sp.]